MEKEHIIIFSHKGNNVFPKSELDLAKALDFYSQVDIQQLLSLWVNSSKSPWLCSELSGLHTHKVITGDWTSFHTESSFPYLGTRK